MKRGILILFLFVLSITSGCDLDTEYECDVSGAVDYLIRNSDLDVREIKQVLSSNRFNCKALAENEVSLSGEDSLELYRAKIERMMGFREEDLENSVDCSDDEFVTNSEEYEFTADEFCLDNQTTPDFEGYNLVGGDYIVNVDDVVVVTNVIDDPCILAKGDVNMDSNLNVLDVIVLVHHIDESNPLYSDFQICAADVNSDININILDIVSLVELILTNSAYYELDLAKRAVGREYADVNLDWTTNEWHNVCGVMPVKGILTLPLGSEPVAGFQIDLCNSPLYITEDIFEMGTGIDPSIWMVTIEEKAFGISEDSVADPCACGAISGGFCTRL